jgi:hypothetical protein
MKAQTGSRGIVYSFFNLGFRRRRVVNVTTLPFCPREGDSVDRSSVGFGGQSEQERKMLPVPEFEPRIHQPQACRYTD